MENGDLLIALLEVWLWSGAGILGTRTVAKATLKSIFFSRGSGRLSAGDVGAKWSRRILSGERDASV